ncbi:MAG: DUF3667 domain-containing protein, partial [Sphingobacteriales bacterium]
HLDKGFGFTLKELVIFPGKMQRAFIEGNRSKYQKPFSMFFICITIAALLRYWVSSVLRHYYNVGEISEQTFYHEYMVILQVALVPVYTLIAWIAFIRSRYNYAEIGVLMLYTLSFFCMVSSLTFLLKLIWPEMDTAYVELPVLMIYNLITFTNFFKEDPKWLVGLKTIVMFGLIFLFIQYAENMLIPLI